MSAIGDLAPPRSTDTRPTRRERIANDPPKRRPTTSPLTSLLVFLLVAPAAPAAPAPADDFFQDRVVRTFRIQIDEAGLGVVQKNDRSYVHATVTEGTNVLRDVGVHLKGMGSFRPFNEKPSLAVKFDRFVGRQRYRGLTKIMLNNASQDPTYLAELLATQMFREAGVPAARVSHAFVEVNGRPLGLYVVIEAMNREFLRHYFDNPRGNLYEAYLQDIDQRLDQDGGSDESQADLKRLVDACRLPDRAQRWKRLPDVLDVDGYLSHLAVEMFTAHTDGYAMNRNNYRLYHDPMADRFVFLAHGIDWAFAGTGSSIWPRRNSIVTGAILETPEGQRAFRSRIHTLFTNVFQIEAMTNRINAAVAKLKGAARNPGEASEFAGWGAEMRIRLLARHRYVAEQLAVPEPQRPKFAADGTAGLTVWLARTNQGNAVLDRPALGGVATLRIRAGQGEVIASWRAGVLLEEGRYTFEGRVRTAHVVALTNKLELGTNGAGLRISGEKSAKRLTGDNDWTALQYEFEVQPGGDEKVMVCELRAKEGEAWFDPASLRLVRRP